jgi:hypothetical protein
MESLFLFFTQSRSHSHHTVRVQPQQYTQVPHQYTLRTSESGRSGASLSRTLAHGLRPTAVEGLLYVGDSWSTLHNNYVRPWLCMHK